MVDEELPLNDLGSLAEAEMADKRQEVGAENRARELYDVPTETAEQLEEQQSAEDRRDS